MEYLWSIYGVSMDKKGMASAIPFLVSYKIHRLFFLKIKSQVLAIVHFIEL
jgi:hypothetical protein